MAQPPPVGPPGGGGGGAGACSPRPSRRWGRWRRPTCWSSTRAGGCLAVPEHGRWRRRCTWPCTPPGPTWGRSAGCTGRRSPPSPPPGPRRRCCTGSGGWWSRSPSGTTRTWWPPSRPRPGRGRPRGRPGDAAGRQRRPDRRAPTSTRPWPAPGASRTGAGSPWPPATGAGRSTPRRSAAAAAGTTPRRPAWPAGCAPPPADRPGQPNLAAARASLEPGGRPLVHHQDPGRLQVPDPLGVAGLGLAGPGVDAADAPLAVDGVLAADLGHAPLGGLGRRHLGQPVAVLGAALDPAARVPDLVRVVGGRARWRWRSGSGRAAGTRDSRPGRRCAGRPGWSRPRRGRRRRRPASPGRAGWSGAGRSAAPRPAPSARWSPGPGPWWSGSPRSWARPWSRAGSWRWPRWWSWGPGGWSRSRPGPVPTAAAAGHEPRGQPRDRDLERRPGNSTSRPLHRLSAGATIVAAMMQLDAPERDVPAARRCCACPGRPCWWWPGSPAPARPPCCRASTPPGRWSSTRSRSGPGSSAGSAGSPTGCGGRWSTPSTSCGSWSPCPAPPA